MSKFITIQPIKQPVFTATQELNFQFNFAAWRLHLWGKSCGTYTQIEQKVLDGRLLIGTCPDEKCECRYEKFK